MDDQHTEQDEHVYEPPRAEDLDTEVTPAVTSAAAPAASQV